MNYRKFRKNAKALSPITATIILITFTIAVIVAARSFGGIKKW
jgi:flagellin-like protein